MPRRASVPPVPTRPELAHENPILAPLLIAVLREMSERLRETYAEAGHAPPLATGMNVATARVIDAWADQIEAFHAPKDEPAADDMAEPVPSLIHQT